MEANPTYWSDRRVCVTGGTGLLGYPIVCRLQEFGARVRVLALRPRATHPIHRLPGVELVWGDVRDPAVVERAVSDCDVVFHVAGVAAVWGPDLSRLHDIHVRGTRCVLEAAPAGSRVVYTSSVVAVGAGKSHKPLNEDNRFNLEALRVDYVQCKRAAEHLALDEAGQGRDVVITNPGFLIGPDDSENSMIGRLCRRFWRGMVPLAPPGGFNFVDSRDAAEGHLLAAEHGRAGRRYILGGENLTFPAFLGKLAEVAGMQPRAFPVVPWWTLAALAKMSELSPRLTREDPYPAVQQARLNRYYWFYDSQRAARELGYEFRPIVQTLEEKYRCRLTWAPLEVRGLSRWWMRAREVAPADAGKRLRHRPDPATAGPLRGPRAPRAFRSGPGPTPQTRAQEDRDPEASR